MLGSLLRWLHDPELVWRWQSRFGVEKLPVPADHDPNSVLPHRIGNRGWLWLFRLGAWIGHEMFYLLVFPLWWWNLDTDTARKVYAVWALVMWMGQGGKELIGWPRPASPPVVVLERAFIEEFGFPSSHAVVAVALPSTLLHFAGPLCHLSWFRGLALVAAWASLVCWSRIFMGVHTFLEILAGLVEGLGILVLLFPLVEAVDPLLMSGPLWLYIPFCLATLGLAYAYPKKDGKWCEAWSDSVGILSANVSLYLGSRAGVALGFVSRWEGCLLFVPSAGWWWRAIARTLLGYAAFIATRQVLKRLCQTVAARVTGESREELKRRQLVSVEFWTKSAVYFGLGAVVAFFAPLMHSLLNIPK